MSDWSALLPLARRELHRNLPPPPKGGFRDGDHVDIAKLPLALDGHAAAVLEARATCVGTATVGKHLCFDLSVCGGLATADDARLLHGRIRIDAATGAILDFTLALG